MASHQNKEVRKEIRINSEHHHNFVVRVALGSLEEKHLPNYARLLELRMLEATWMSYVRSKQDRMARRRKRGEDDEEEDE